MKKTLSAMLLLLLAALPASATLIGDTIDARWRFGSFDMTDSLLVGPGLETIDWAESDSILDISDSAISIDLTIGVGLNPGVNWTFSDLDWVGTPGQLVDVAVSTNYTGWDDSFVTFGSDWVDVYFADFVSFNSADDFFQIELVTRHDPIPEPMTLSLLGMGVAGLVARRRFLA